MKKVFAHSRIHSFVVASLLILVCLAMPASETPTYPPAKFPAASGWGKNIQRTMRLLATSTAENRNTVRILFYGQSIFLFDIFLSAPPILNRSSF